MDDKLFTQIITAGIKIGTISTLKALGILPEVVSAPDAEREYTKELIIKWRKKGWITGYPSGNTTRAKYYFKRSELERASAMDSLGNVLTINKPLCNLF